jgi:hypothetical protein
VPPLWLEAKNVGKHSDSNKLDQILPGRERLLGQTADVTEEIRACCGRRFILDEPWRYSRIGR